MTKDVEAVRTGREIVGDVSSMNHSTQERGFAGRGRVGPRTGAHPAAAVMLRRTSAARRRDGAGALDASCHRRRGGPEHAGSCPEGRLTLQKLSSRSLPCAPLEDAGGAPHDPTRSAVTSVKVGEDASGHHRRPAVHAARRRRPRLTGSTRGDRTVARRTAVTGGPTPMDATRGHANASTCDPSGSPRSHVPRRSCTEVTGGLARSSTARAHEARATDDRREHGDEAPEARGSDVREGGNASRDRPARRSEHLGMKPRAPATRGNATRSAPRRRGYPFFEPSIVGLQTSVEKTGVTADAAPTWRRELSLRERYAPRSRGEPGDLARRASAGVSPA